MEAGTVARRILYPPPLSGEADPFVDWSLTTEEQRIDEESGRAIQKFPGFGGKFHESHVLLSACGKEQTAYEKDGAGLFTGALMKVLVKKFGKSCGQEEPKLTYSTLMANLVMPD